ncbi:ankyrin repeat-containing domain protein [Massariosphaeria phaeospora]|uniref:Ankyrin repeat-containing domain protein n=1 Tax=Massariosphaeria phaeospora TaxID=100035 RepID=A0A7C8IF25_9PLEO|nr:ankyrin repeat-containing domain protein [Massariosphaeria phaeospora]
MVALHNKHAEAVKTLLHVGANPSAETSLGNTALHLAVSKGLVNITTILLEAGADPNYANIRGATALRHAVDYTTPQIYSSLTPPSSYEDVVECIRTLFKFGADPNLADTSDEVPLHLAVESDRLEIPRLLLKSNAHVDALGGKKRTPLHYAAMSDTESAPNMCLLLIKVGADLELFSDDHDTPLRAAVKKSNTNVAKILLEAGANPNAFQDAECCPVTYALHSAVQAGPAAIVNMLLYHGAEVTARDKTLSTALHCACEHSSNEIAATLLNHPGIDINAQDSAGNTPFLVATMMYNLKLMRFFLLGRGFNLNRRDNDGATALHFAAREGNPEHVQWLLEMGADATIHTVCCNDLTGTPADIARQCDHDSTVEVLEAWVKEHDRHAYSSWNLALTKFEEEGDDGEEEGAPSESST